MSQVQILSPRPLIVLDVFSRKHHWFQFQNNNWFQFWFHFSRVVGDSHGETRGNGSWIHPNRDGPVPLRGDPQFQPCATEPGDELYPNGIFEFNISRLIAFISAHPERVPNETVELSEIADYGNSDRLDDAAIQVADLSRPVILAEILPERFSLIDGHHQCGEGSTNAVEHDYSKPGFYPRTAHSNCRPVSASETSRAYGKA